MNQPNIITQSITLKFAISFAMTFYLGHYLLHFSTYLTQLTIYMRINSLQPSLAFV